MALNHSARISLPTRTRVMQMPIIVPPTQRAKVRGPAFPVTSILKVFETTSESELGPLTNGSTARKDGSSTIMPSVVIVARRITASHSINDGRSSEYDLLL